MGICVYTKNKNEIKINDKDVVKNEDKVEKIEIIENTSKIEKNEIVEDKFVARKDEKSQSLMISEQQKIPKKIILNDNAMYQNYNISLSNQPWKKAGRKSVFESPVMKSRKSIILVANKKIRPSVCSPTKPDITLINIQK